jgi:assimilatory nitrate reductase catalytic subunit
VVAKATRTTCPYCGVGCGVIVTNTSSAVVVTGDPDHPANFGRLCSKGAALGQTLALDGRLLRPRVVERVAGMAQTERDVSWDEALDLVSHRFSDIIGRHGPESIALYVSGQLLTEDYYVANKLVKGWLGTGNIDTNSRLCMASAVAGYKRAFGEDIVPCSYEDVEVADLVILVGSNAAWCHPVLYQRIIAAREKNPNAKLVVIDPRRTPSCDQADLHLPIKPGADGLLFNGLLAYLADSPAFDSNFVSASTEGFDLSLQSAKAEGSLSHIAEGCGLDYDRVLEFFALFENTVRVVTLFSQGINQSSSGTDKVNAIINCHLVTGRIGIPGAGPFSITGQPNAMGGREVGGLANTLAAHMDLDNPAHRNIVQSFWESPRIASEPGLKAVELFEAIGQGRIKAVWIIATNPVVSMPLADSVRDALANCEFVVVSDCIAGTDTARMAHVLLPATAWGEKDGTVTNSERRISRQRAFLEAPGLTKPDWWALCEVAKRLGFKGFDFQSAHQIFLEHARLSAADNETGSSQARFFNLEQLTGLSEAEFDDLSPVRWPVTKRINPDTRPIGTRRARFIPIKSRGPTNACSSQYPFTLNTGRIRDQWHTMTRSGRAPQLNSHRPEPYLEIHPHDALSTGVKDSQLARVTSSYGAMVARVRVTADQQPGNIFIPIHWSDANASDARVGGVVSSAVDPLSGEPEFKHTPGAIEGFPVDWYAFILSREKLPTDRFSYFAYSQGEQHFRYEIAGRGDVPDWTAWSQNLIGGGGDWLDYRDSARGEFRAARIVAGRLESTVFVAPRPELPDRSWLSGLFASERITSQERLSILAACAGAGLRTGVTVCACFGVGSGTIGEAIRGGADSTAAIGLRVRAGTNCGSCVPELRRMLMAAREVAV